MNQKRGIPLVAIIIFFALIIGIIITCVIILATQSGKSNNSTINLTSNSNNNNNSNNVNEVMRNAIVDDDNDDEDENENNSNGEEININSSDVKGLFKNTGNQKTFAKYAIYGSNGDISNDLKLKIALASVKDSEINVDNNVKTISKDKVDNYLIEIFGSTNNIKYNDVELYNDDNFSKVYNVEKYVYKKDNEVYEIVESGINENQPSFINDYIEKAVKYDDRIEIYVVPLFVKTFSIDNNDMGYQLYSGYNFENKDFDGELMTTENSVFAVTSQTYRENVISNDSIDGFNHEIIEGNVKDFDLLQRFKYVFKKDNNSGKYYLTSFEEAEDEEEDNNNNNNSNNYNENRNNINDVDGDENN
ncbi:MAG: hypothetical protein IKF52_04120 [Clostridia bacterium]|nr:hypothetical protein [Clostridia bacterium]